MSAPVPELTRATPLTAFRTASARVDAVPIDAGGTALPRLTDAASDAAPDIDLNINTSLAAVEDEWRRFEQAAAATPFQSYEWLAAWHRHVGIRSGVVPVIVVGRFATNEMAFILPLAIRRGPLRRLCWLGQDLCDYNAPLVSRGLSRRLTPESFRRLWRELQTKMQADHQTRHDWIEFEKMPETIGDEINPFIGLELTPNANSAHIMRLGDDWETFYRAKRSSATRRHDRAKRRRMAQFGEIRFVTAADAADARTTLETLMRQKSVSFAHKGIPDMFARPGYREFFLDVASNPAMRHCVHVSRVEVGSVDAAANFAIVHGDCYYHILSSYCDGRVAHFGPGALHLRELMAHATKLGLGKFDFTIGDERYKTEWCDERLRLSDYCAAASWRGWPASALSAARRRLKRYIKQTPAAWRIVSDLRAAFGAFLRQRRS
jgi:CelD/BcsL family acetyltransferase involved in cellulose biosynthesis